jgi:hypothetical protein
MRSDKVRWWDKKTSGPRAGALNTSSSKGLTTDYQGVEMANANLTGPRVALVPPPLDSCPECGQRCNTAYHVTPPDGSPPSYVCHYVCRVCDHYWKTSWLLSALGAA